MIYPNAAIPIAICNARSGTVNKADYAATAKWLVTALRELNGQHSTVIRAIRVWKHEWLPTIGGQAAAQCSASARSFE